MQYIRTKDKIIALDLENFTEKAIDHVENIGGKIADNIDKLCDEFVIIDKGKREHLTKLEYIERKEWVFKNGQLNGKKYYEVVKLFGAIWTDKGLIYKVKMNDKGEMELL